MNLQKYTFIHTRRDWSTLYKSNDSTHFLKVGEKTVIKHEKELYGMLWTYDISWPKIIEYGKHKESYFLKETSLGEKTFMMLLQEENDQEKRNILINELIKQASTLLSKQSKIIDIVPPRTNKNNAFDEIRDEKLFSKEFVDNREKWTKNILKTVPKTRCHGDYNPYNILPNWIIDLEDSQINYLWYDQISLMTHIYRFPNEKRTYNYTAEQLKFAYNKRTNEYEVFNDTIWWALFLLRGARALQRMGKRIELQKYRKNKIEPLIQWALQWKKIFSTMIEAFNE